MPRRQETYELTAPELRDLLEQATRAGAEHVLRELRGLLGAQLAGRGIVDRAMIAAAYQVSEDTVKRWAERHGFREVDGPNRRRVYYRWSECVEAVPELTEAA